MTIAPNFAGFRMRPTDINGRTAPNDYVAMYQWRWNVVGRIIYHEMGFSTHWSWVVWIGDVMPQGGSEDTLDLAQKALKRYVLALTEVDRIKKRTPGEQNRGP